MSARGLYKPSKAQAAVEVAAAPVSGDDSSPAVYCVVGNIPSDLHSADLRAFFSQITELGGFHCFHYRHRPELKPTRTPEDQPSSSADSNTTDNTAAATSSSPAPPPTCCCVIGVKQSHLVDLLRNYDKKLWVDQAGKYRKSRVHISQLKTKQTTADMMVTGDEPGNTAVRSSTHTRDIGSQARGAGSRTESVTCGDDIESVPAVIREDRVAVECAPAPSSHGEVTHNTQCALSCSDSQQRRQQQQQQQVGSGRHSVCPAPDNAAPDTTSSSSGPSPNLRTGNSPASSPSDVLSHPGDKNTCMDNVTMVTPTGTHDPGRAALQSSTMTDNAGNDSGIRDDVDGGDDDDALALEQLVKLPELRPPSVLPNGNVGTPNEVLMDLIARCKFPPRLITKLGLNFPTMKRPHRYASVPFMYSEESRRHRRGDGGGDGEHLLPSSTLKARATALSSALYGKKPSCSRSEVPANAGSGGSSGCGGGSGGGNGDDDDVAIGTTTAAGEQRAVHGGGVWTTADGHRLCDDTPGEGTATAAPQPTTEAEMTTTDVTTPSPSVASNLAAVSGKTPKVSAAPSKPRSARTTHSSNVGSHVVDDDDGARENHDEVSSEEEVIGEEDDHDAEEWDRYEALHDDVDKQGRTEERLFENEIELKWEKGGSGLVFYTDAAYWDELKGEEDERLADEYDVDLSIFYEPNSGTKDANDIMDMEMETQRRHGKHVVDWRGKTGFDKLTKGFGGRVLRDQGWAAGKGLGRAGQGIAEPVEADGQTGHDKRGLGFLGEKLRRDVCGAAKPQRHITTKYDASDYTDTMLRTRGPLAQKRLRAPNTATAADSAAAADNGSRAKRKHVNEEGNVAKINN